MPASVSLDGARPRPASVSIVGMMVRFTAAGLVVLAALAVLIALVARQAGRQQAEDAARQVTLVTAKGVAEPRLTPALVSADPAALTSFTAAMRDLVLKGSLVRVKVWDATGRIVYSDESRLIGERFDLGPDELTMLRSGGIDSDLSDLQEPENRFERPFDSLLEVYVGVRSTTGVPLLFEAYFRYDAVAEAGDAQWRKYAPVALGGLVLLQLVQIPFAYSLARRLQRRQEDAERWWRHAVVASDDERRRIAADLHDGVVQDLTGLTYALDAARLGPPDAARDRALLAETATGLRTGVGDLRTLMVEVYPPRLAEEGLAAALGDLAESTAQRSGTAVDVAADGVDDVPVAAASVVYRCAQELLRNVVTHSGAEHADVLVERRSGLLRLVVDDDGRGMASGVVEARQDEGHFGLRALTDLVTGAGGTVRVRSAPAQGTRVEVEVPC